MPFLQTCAISTPAEIVLAWPYISLIKLLQIKPYYVLFIECWYISEYSLFMSLHLSEKVFPLVGWPVRPSVSQNLFCMVSMTLPNTHHGPIDVLIDNLSSLPNTHHGPIDVTIDRLSSLIANSYSLPLAQISSRTIFFSSYRFSPPLFILGP